jgi:hypothetical protein
LTSSHRISLADRLSERNFTLDSLEFLELRLTIVSFF